MSCLQCSIVNPSEISKSDNSSFDKKVYTSLGKSSTIPQVYPPVLQYLLIYAFDTMFLPQNYGKNESAWFQGYKCSISDRLIFDATQLLFKFPALIHSCRSSNCGDRSRWGSAADYRPGLTWRAIRYKVPLFWASWGEICKAGLLEEICLIKYSYLWAEKRPASSCASWIATTP